jgi:hypothetical protein
MFLGNKVCLVCKANNPFLPSVSAMSRKLWILDITQPYGPTLYFYRTHLMINKRGLSIEMAQMINWTKTPLSWWNISGFTHKYQVYNLQKTALKPWTRFKRRILFMDLHIVLVCGLFNYYKYLLLISMLGGCPVTTIWHVLGLQKEGQSPALEGSCKYIK